MPTPSLLLGESLSFNQMPYILDLIVTIMARMVGIALETPMRDRLDEFNRRSSTPKQTLIEEDADTVSQFGLVNTCIPQIIDTDSGKTLLVVAVLAQSMNRWPIYPGVLTRCLSISMALVRRLALVASVLASVIQRMYSLRWV